MVGAWRSRSGRGLVVWWSELGGAARDVVWWSELGGAAWDVVDVVWWSELGGAARDVVDVVGPSSPGDVILMPLDGRGVMSGWY